LVKKKKGGSRIQTGGDWKLLPSHTKYHQQCDAIIANSVPEKTISFVALFLISIIFNPASLLM